MRKPRTGILHGNDPTLAKRLEKKGRRKDWKLNTLRMSLSVMRDYEDSLNSWAEAIPEHPVYERKAKEVTSVIERLKEYIGEVQS